MAPLHAKAEANAQQLLAEEEQAAARAAAKKSKKQKQKAKKQLQRQQQQASPLIIDAEAVESLPGTLNHAAPAESDSMSHTPWSSTQDSVRSATESTTSAYDVKKQRGSLAPVAQHSEQRGSSGAVAQHSEQALADNSEASARDSAEHSDTQAAAPSSEALLCQDALVESMSVDSPQRQGNIHPPKTAETASAQERRLSQLSIGNEEASATAQGVDATLVQLLSCPITKVTSIVLHTLLPAC